MTTHTQAQSRARVLPGGVDLLRFALKLDAVVSGVNGAAYLIAAGALDGPLGVSAGALRGIGAFLLVFAAAVWAVAISAPPGRRAVRAIVAGNAGWAVASLALLAFGWADPALLGGVWIALQALVVAGFAALQHHALAQVG